MQNEKLMSFLTSMFPALAAVIVGGMILKKIQKRR